MSCVLLQGSPQDKPVRFCDSRHSTKVYHGLPFFKALPVTLSWRQRASMPQYSLLSSQLNNPDELSVSRSYLECMRCEREGQENHIKWIWRSRWYTSVRKHLTRGFLCAVWDLSGTLWPLLIPEYSGIKRRGTPFLGLRNPGISHYSDKHPLPFYEPDGKRWLFAALSLIGIVFCFVSLEF